MTPRQGRFHRSETHLAGSRLRASGDPAAHIVAAVGKVVRNIIAAGAVADQLDIRTVLTPGGLLIIAEGHEATPTL